MTTTSTQKNEQGDQPPKRDVPDRGERARRLQGLVRKFSPDRDAVAELVAERDLEP